MRVTRPRARTGIVSPVARTPLDPRQAVLHGLSLRPAQAGHYTLYATNHGGRESVEAFDIDGRGATPSATWVGCVLMPDKLAANSVAAFGDGALVSTVVSLPGKTSPDGRNTGAVFMWTPGENMFHRLDGTELPVNNGIETSADDRQFFVASMGLRQIVAFSRADPSKPMGFAQLTGSFPTTSAWSARVWWRPEWPSPTHRVSPARHVPAALPPKPSTRRHSSSATSRVSLRPAVLRYCDGHPDRRRDLAQLLQR
jgi:hypothetical protein